MTIAPAVTRTTYVLAGSNLGPFATVWPFETAADLVAYINTGAGVVKLASGAGFSVSSADSLSLGGQVTLDPGYLPVGGWGLGSTLTIARETAADQPSAFGEVQGFSPLASEQALDHVDRQAQDLRSDLGRALAWPPGEQAFDLPTATVRAGKLLAFDSFGAPTAAPAGVTVTTSASLYDTAAQVALAAITVAAAWIATAGFAVAGDLGAGLYKRVGGAPAHQAYLRSADGAYWELAETRPRPEQLGAKGDGTDDAPAFQKWLDYLKLKGGEGQIAARQYLLNATVTLDLTGHTALLDGRTVKIRGAGPGASILRNGSNGIGLRVVGDVTTESSQGAFAIEGVGFTKSGAGTGDTAVKLEQQVFAVFRDCLFYANTKGVVATDLISCQFYSCNWRFNSYGMDLAGAVAAQGSPPNAINLYGCSFYGQANYAIHALGGCQVNMFGGAVETTSGGADFNRFGVKLETAGQFGVPAATFTGVYFERNGNTADIWLVNGDYPTTLNCYGCNFNRVSNVDFCANNILIDTNGNTNVEVKVNLIGSGFRQFGTYVASAARAYVKVTGGTPVLLNDAGAYYNVGLERPALPSMAAFAEGRFTGAGALFTGSNILGVARTGVGAYTVTFRDANPNVNYRRFHASLDILGFVRETGQTGTTLSLQVANNAGAAADPGVVNLLVYE